jgi:periplasmic protein CpxP/Spy
LLQAELFAHEVLLPPQNPPLLRDNLFTIASELLGSDRPSMLGNLPVDDPPSTWDSGALEEFSNQTHKGATMPLTSEQRDAIASESKTLGASLSLSDDQKQKLHGFMTEASERLQEYKQQHPNASREDLMKKIADNRASIRQRLTKVLTPEQLTKWDAEVSKAREFLGQKLAA